MDKERLEMAVALLREVSDILEDHSLTALAVSADNLGNDLEDYIEETEEELE